MTTMDSECGLLTVNQLKAVELGLQTVSTTGQVLTSWTEPGKRSGEKGELAEGSVLVAALPQHSWPSLLQLLVNASPKPPQDRGSDVPY